MCRDMSLTPIGAHEGIKEHEKKINHLISELADLRDLKQPTDREYDRMGEIQEEIAYRQIQIDKLKDFLANQSRN